MSTKKTIVIFLIFLLISTTIFNGCSDKDGQSILEVISVFNPFELSEELQNITIYFDKNVKDENIISIVSLDLKSNEKYILLDEGNNVDLSPDKRVVTYIHGEFVDGEYHHGLWIYELGEKTETKIAGWEKEVSEVFISNPSFSYNGKQIIFSVTWLDQVNTGLAVVDKDGSNLKILRTSLPLNEGPEYSPDNSLIIVTCAGIDALTGDPGFQLCLLDKDGQQLRPLTNRGHGHGSYYFTPDGKKIVFSEFEHGGFFGIINKPEDRFYIMDIDGENKTLLLNWEVGVRGFSDDGKEIIFKGRLDEKSPWGIYLINIDGTNLRHLTYFDEFLEEWYADIEQY